MKPAMTFQNMASVGNYSCPSLWKGVRLQAEGCNDANKYHANVKNAINAIPGQTFTNSYFDADLKDLFIAITALKNVQWFMVCVPPVPRTCLLPVLGAG